TATVRFLPCYTAAISLKRGRPSTLRSSGCCERRSLSCACGPLMLDTAPVRHGPLCSDNARMARFPGRGAPSLEATSAERHDGLLIGLTRREVNTPSAALQSARCAVSTPPSVCPQALGPLPWRPGFPTRDPCT